MNRLLVLAFACVALGAAAQEVSPDLASARTLSCKFGGGTRTTWVGGQPKTADARLDDEVVFDSIDLPNGTVRVLASVRIDQAHVALSPVGMFVVDARPGVIEMMTIFPKGADGSFPAVDMRQLNSSGPSTEQYFGNCRLQR